MIKVSNDVPNGVLSFVRRNDKDKVFAVINLSAEPQLVTFQESLHHGLYADYFRGESVAFGDSTTVRLPPWGYRVFVRGRRAAGRWTRAPLPGIIQV